MKSVTVHVATDDHEDLHCPQCHKKCSGYDHRVRTWRHLDTCQYKTLVHEGGYTIVNAEVEINTDTQAIDPQYFKQLNTTNTTQFEYEKNLRHDWESFNVVRQLMPTLYRFRILNVDGKDIEHIYETGLNNWEQSPRGDCREYRAEYCVTPVARWGDNDIQSTVLSPKPYRCNEAQNRLPVSSSGA